MYGDDSPWVSAMATSFWEKILAKCPLLPPGGMAQLPAGLGYAKWGGTPLLDPVFWALGLPSRGPPFSWFIHTLHWLELCPSSLLCFKAAWTSLCSSSLISWMPLLVYFSHCPRVAFKNLPRNFRGLVLVLTPHGTLGKVTFPLGLFPL